MVSDDCRWSENTTTCLRLINTVNWPKLQAYASTLHSGREECHAEGPVKIGGRNFVRVLTFEKGEKWLARFPKNLHDVDDSVMLREADCLRIIDELSTVPVPKIFAAVSRKAEIGAAFMLMEVLPGDVGIDIDGGLVPQQFKSTFFKQMANAQVQISNIVFPRIGTPVRHEDGTIHIGPIPGIGGPFDTASAFFRAWADSVTFPMTKEEVLDNCGPQGEEIWKSTSSFPAGIARLANSIAGRYDEGPFPLVHVDYGHNNIVVDTKYNMLGVIDWENAIVAPWVMVEYPLTVRATPMSMDSPLNYHADGTPKDADLISNHEDREEYLRAVIDAERELDIPSKLSKVLSDSKLRDVAAAMKLFRVDGKMGYYSRVLETFEDVAGG